MQKTALITGVRGFTGQYMREALELNGYQVTGTSVGGDVDVSRGELVLDVRSSHDWITLIGRLRPSYIVHLAAQSFVAHGDDIGFYDVNVLGAVNLLKACSAVNHAPEKILIASSANVYGSAAGMLDESTPLAPISHYGASKVAMEHLVRTWFDRFPIVITRPFNYTGRGQSSRFLVPKVVSHFAGRQMQIELGNLDVARDFSDVRDVAAAYMALLEKPESAGETINICSGKAYSLEKILDICRCITGRDLAVHVNPKFVRRNEIKLLAGSPEKLKKYLPERKLITLESTIDWMLNSTLD
jgi:nucleoside-diphosphate-sugar epimerase